MAGEWNEVSLAAIMDVKHGFAFPGENIRDEASDDILLTPGNFAIGGGFKGDKYKFFDGEVPDSYVLTEGDLVVTMTDLSKAADTLGYPALVPKLRGHRFLHNQRIGKVLIKDGAEIDKGFLFYLLRTAEYRHEVLASATGSTVRHTSPGRILAHKTCIPPLPTQRAIASVLGTLDDLIELNRETNEILEEIARALFKSWFVDFDPVRAKLEGRPPAGMDAATAALFPDHFQDSELGQIPKGWEVKSLDEIADFLNGLALQKFPANDGPTLPVIKIAQLRKGDVAGADRCNTNVPTEFVVQDGDVLFSWSGTLAVEIWCGGNGALNQHLFKVTSAEFPKWFYLNWTRQHLEWFQSVAADKAVTMGHIKRGHLTEAKVMIPSGEIIDAMTAIMDPLIEQVISNRIESRDLATLRDTLLPKLLSGEITVPVAEELIAAVK
jgi:type I restriction enzyme S subunit